MALEADSSSFHRVAVTAEHSSSPPNLADHSQQIDASTNKPMRVVFDSEMHAGSATTG